MTKTKKQLLMDILSGAYILILLPFVIPFIILALIGRYYREHKVEDKS